MTIPDGTTLTISIVVGLATGCVYALVALSFNLVLAASGVFNLVTGAMIGGAVILTYEFMVLDALNPFVVVLIVMVLGGIAGGAAEIIGVRRMLRDAQSVSHDTMVSTLSLGLIGDALASIWFGGKIDPVKSYVSAKPIVLDKIPIQPLYLVMPVVVVGVTVIIELILRYTEFGVVTRAVIANPEGASLAGIKVARVVQVSFIAAGVMAALAGFLVAPVVSASAGVGDSVQLVGFAAIGIGGFGSFRGCLVGGLIVGLIVGIMPAFFAPTWTQPVVYLVVVIVLLARPAGLFGRRGQFGSLGTRQV